MIARFHADSAEDEDTAEDMALIGAAIPSDLSNRVLSKCGWA